MEKYFALIKNSLVQHVIVADDDFLKHVEKDYDYVVDVTNQTRPNPGDSYYAKTGSFVQNDTEIIEIPSSEPTPELNFEPFQLSKYTVHHENGYIIIGCKKYSAAGFIEALKKIATQTEDTTSHFSTLYNGPAHGKFGISWADVKKLHDVIVKGQS